jgi:hypothetical protein
MTENTAYSQPEVLEGAPLRYAPTNELGVVFLFAHLARRWRLHIDAIQPNFPDCIAYQKVQGQEKKIRIEFEYMSKNFLTHGHDPEKCDCIVCWEHNWPDAPKKLQIIELRREFGLGFNVWIMPINDPYKEELDKINSYSPDEWSLPSQCHKGDLILYYLTQPQKSIQHIFVAVDRSLKTEAGWKPGKDYMGIVKRVCKLKAPIFLEDLRQHRVLSTAHFVRGSMQGRPNATEYWPYLYDMIVRRNPSVWAKLKKFAPEQI